MGAGLPPLRRGLATVALAWFRILHPFPSILVTIAAVLFTVMAGHGHGSASRLLLVGGAMLCAQFAIGTVNDLADQALDAATKPWKPLARGAIRRRAAVSLAYVLCLISVACGVLLGPAACVALLIGLGCGLGYDLWLKRTSWSWMPYCLALPTLPMFAWAAAGNLTARLLPAYPLGVLLGLTLHLANTLPDLDGDRAFGIRGLTHGLGRRQALLLCYGSLAFAQLLTLLLAPVLRYQGPGYLIGLCCSVSIGSLAAALYWARPTRDVLQLNFGVLAIAVLALALGWLDGAVVR